MPTPPAMTTNEVINFDFRNNDVRVIEKDGEPWFVARDVCDVLGLGNPSMTLRTLDSDHKHQFNLGLPGRAPLFINEAGLYDLIFQSRKPQAREFKRWVTGTVLPSIRKNGGYISGQEQHASGQMDDATFMAQALQVANRVLEERTPSYDVLFRAQSRVPPGAPEKCPLLNIR